MSAHSAVAPQHRPQSRPEVALPPEGSDPESENNPKQHSAFDPIIWFGVLPLTIVGLLLRLYYSNEPIGWDEAKVVSWIWQFPLLELLGKYDNMGNHFLMTLLTGLSMKAFGNDLWAIRLPSVLFGVALIPVTYYCIAMLVNRSSALLTAALIAGSSNMILTSANARGYMPQAFFVALLVPLARNVVYQGGLRNIFFFSLTLTLSLYLLPSTLLVVPGIGLWALYVGFEQKGMQGVVTAAKRGTVCMLSSAVATLLLYAYPVYHTGFDNIHAFTRFRLTLDDIFHQHYRVFDEVLNGFHWDLPMSFIWTFLGLSVLGLLYCVAQKRTYLVLLVLLSLSCLGVSILFRTVGPVRSFMFVAPFYFSFGAIGFSLLFGMLSRKKAELGRFPAIASALALVAFMSFMAFTGSDIERAFGYSRPRGIEQFVKDFDSELTEKDAVIGFTPQVSFWMHYYDLDRAHWRRFNLAEFKRDAGERLFVVIQHDPKTIERVMKRLKTTKLSGAEEGMFTEPVLYREYPNVRVYLLRANRKS